MHRKEEANVATSHCGKKRRFGVQVTFDNSKLFQDQRKSFKQDTGEQSGSDHQLKKTVKEGSSGVAKIHYQNIPDCFAAEGGVLPYCISNGSVNLSEFRLGKNQAVSLPENWKLVPVATHQGDALLKLFGHLLDEGATLKGSVEGNGNISKQGGHGERIAKHGVDGAQQQHLGSKTDVGDAHKQSEVTTSPANGDRQSDDSTAVCQHTAVPKDIKTRGNWNPRHATELFYSFTHENGVCKGPMLSEILDAKGVMPSAPAYSSHLTSKPKQNVGNSHGCFSCSQNPHLSRTTSKGEESDTLTKPSAGRPNHASAESGEALADSDGHAAWTSICSSLCRTPGETRCVHGADERHDGSAVVLESSRKSGSSQVADAQVHIVGSVDPDLRCSSDFGANKSVENSDCAPSKQIAGQKVVPLFYIGGGSSASVDNKGDTCKQQIPRINTRIIPILNTPAVSWNAKGATQAGKLGADYLHKLAVIRAPTNNEHAVLEECEGAIRCSAHDESPSIVEKECGGNRNKSGGSVVAEIRLPVSTSLIRRSSEVKTEPALPTLDPKTRAGGNKPNGSSSWNTTSEHELPRSTDAAFGKVVTGPISADMCVGEDVPIEVLNSNATNSSHTGLEECLVHDNKTEQVLVKAIGVNGSHTINDTSGRLG